MTDPPVGQTDRQTELRWPRRATAVAAAARKKLGAAKIPVSQFGTFSALFLD